MRKICIIATSRATYGYKRKIIQLLKKDKSVKLSVIATGMHLEKKFGYTLKDLIKDKVPITKKIKMNIKDSNKLNFTKSLSLAMSSIAIELNNINPDLVLVTGDRSEMFVACIASVFQNIPVAHIQAGDVSGHIDGNVRHAITKLSHVHLASCLDSKNRVIKLGEEKKRVFNVGAPQLDDIQNIKKNKLFISNFLKIKNNLPVALVIQHPVLIDSHLSGNEIITTLKALKTFKMNFIVLYPNFDTGSKKIIEEIDKYKKLRNFFIFKNLERSIFLNLLANIDFLIGNSSAGILEAPSFKLPVINIGNRQRGRMQANNVVNCTSTLKNIVKKINYIQKNANFKKQIKLCKNPYGDGKSSERIVKILKNIDLKDILDKKITY